MEDGDLCYLANLNNLESLAVIGRNIRNPEGISNLTHLKSLSLYDNSSEALYDEAERTPFDVQSLAGLTELEWLDLSFLYIEDVSSLANLKELRHTELIRTSVGDISPLENLRNLDEIFIFGNKSELVKEQSEALFNEVETVIVTEEMPNGL